MQPYTAVEPTCGGDASPSALYPRHTSAIHDERVSSSVPQRDAERAKTPLYAFSAHSLCDARHFCSMVKYTAANRHTQAVRRPVSATSAGSHRWSWRCPYVLPVNLVRCVQTPDGNYYYYVPDSERWEDGAAPGQQGPACIGDGNAQLPPQPQPPLSAVVGAPLSTLANVDVNHLSGEAATKLLLEVQQQLVQLQDSLAGLQRTSEASVVHRGTSPSPPVVSSATTPPLRQTAETAAPQDAVVAVAVVESPDCDGEAATVVVRVDADRPQHSGVPPAQTTSRVVHGEKAECREAHLQQRQPFKQEGEATAPLSPPLFNAPRPHSAESRDVYGEVFSASGTTRQSNAGSGRNAYRQFPDDGMASSGSVQSNRTADGAHGTPLLEKAHRYGPQLSQQNQQQQPQQVSQNRAARRKSWTDAVEAAGRNVFVEGDDGRPVTAVKHRVVMIASPAMTPLKTHPTSATAAATTTRTETVDTSATPTAGAVGGAGVYETLDAYMWHLTSPRDGREPRWSVVTNTTSITNAEGDVSLLFASAASTHRLTSATTTATDYRGEGGRYGELPTSPLAPEAAAAPQAVQEDEEEEQQQQRQGRVVTEVTALTAEQLQPQTNARLTKAGRGGSGPSAAVAAAEAVVLANARPASAFSASPEDAVVVVTPTAADAETTAATPAELMEMDAADPSTEASSVPAKSPTPTIDTCKEYFPPLVSSRLRQTVADAFDPHEEARLPSAAKSVAAAVTVEEAGTATEEERDVNVVVARNSDPPRPSTTHPSSRIARQLRPHRPSSPTASHTVAYSYVPSKEQPNPVSVQKLPDPTASATRIHAPAARQAQTVSSAIPTTESRPRRAPRRLSCDAVELPEVRIAVTATDTPDGRDVEESNDRLNASPAPSAGEPSPLLLEQVAAYQVLMSAAAPTAVNVEGVDTAPAAKTTTQAKTDVTSTTAIGNDLQMEKGKSQEKGNKTGDANAVRPLLVVPPTRTDIEQSVAGHRGSASGHTRRSGTCSTADFSAPSGLSETKAITNSMRTDGGEEEEEEGDASDTAEKTTAQGTNTRAEAGSALHPARLPQLPLEGGVFAEARRLSSEVSWSAPSIGSPSHYLHRPSAPSPAATPSHANRAPTAASPLRAAAATEGTEKRSADASVMPQSRRSSAPVSLTVTSKAAGRGAAERISSADATRAAPPAAPTNTKVESTSGKSKAAAAPTTNAPPIDASLPHPPMSTQSSASTTTASEAAHRTNMSSSPLVLPAVAATAVSARPYSADTVPLCPPLSQRAASAAAAEVAESSRNRPSSCCTSTAVKRRPLMLGSTSVLTTGQYRVLRDGTEEPKQRVTSASARDEFREASTFANAAALLRTPHTSPNRSTTSRSPFRDDNSTL